MAVSLSRRRPSGVGFMLRRAAVLERHSRSSTARTESRISAILIDPDRIAEGVRKYVRRVDDLFSLPRRWDDAQ